jgi:hypothetical protein
MEFEFQGPDAAVLKDMGNEVDIVVTRGENTATIRYFRSEETCTNWIAARQAEYDRKGHTIDKYR